MCFNTVSVLDNAIVKRQITASTKFLEALNESIQTDRSTTQRFIKLDCSWANSACDSRKKLSQFPPVRGSALAWFLKQPVRTLKSVRPGDIAMII